MINFDCHAHIYERIASVPDARYVPSAPAPLARWLSHHQKHDIEGGVVVQVSFLGIDNSELCAALAKLDRTRFAGVAVVPLYVSDDALADLVCAGARGVRWNLVRGKVVPDLRSKAVRAFFRKLEQHGLHLEIHLEGPRIAPILEPLTDQGVRIVVDHFGLPSVPNPDRDPMILATNKLTDASSLYFKFSAPYRSSFDVTDHAHALLSKLEDHHVVWGSDWPHTQHEDEVDFASTRSTCNTWGLRSDTTAARDLYGINLDR
ncbi:amidohydrolase family protein [Sedimentitalea sp.]|uniref:amidohydrolase family protein n=1 Tax=Sedimentitalea sp. TaxID=2048915 RepID=UPI0032976042